MTRAVPVDESGDDRSRIEIELDAYVLPSGHRVFKLFPGQTYRLNKAIVSARAAFLDIRGLDVLDGDPTKWSDTQLRRLIAADRIERDKTKDSPTKKPESQDTKRLKFLRNMIFSARKGDLAIVPLGRGLDGEVAIGEFEDDPGVITQVTVEDNEDVFTTWGRRLSWRTVNARRSRFSGDLNKRLHAPTAFHVLERSFIEEVYLAAYGSFTYDNVYVASFQSEKETFTTADQANIGIWFNAVTVVYDREGPGRTGVDSRDTFVELGLEENGVELDLVRNSPLSVVLRTIGPLAFSVAALYATEAEGVTKSQLHHVSISAKAVADAVDKCAVEVPPDLEQIVKGLGHGRYDASCRVQARVQQGALVHSAAHLKSGPRKHK